MTNKKTPQALIKELREEISMLKQLLNACGMNEAAIQTAIRRMKDDR